MIETKGKKFIGSVVGITNGNTVKVRISHVHRHPIYKKAVRRRTDLACHYEGIEIAVGDLVAIQETRPISKTKHFRVIEKVQI